MDKEEDKKVEEPQEQDESKSSEEVKPQKRKKWHLIHPTWLRRTLKTLGVIILVVIALPFLIYVPPVQDFLVSVAEKIVGEKTGLDVKIEHFRLKFPIDLSLQGVSVVEASGDTMVSAKEALVDVKLMPLLHLDVDVETLKLTDAYYRLVSADTSMIMTIRAGFLEIDDQSSVQIKESNINLNKTVIHDANIQMYSDVWKKKPPEEPQDTSGGFFIRINDLEGERIRFGMSSLPTIDTLAIYANDLKLKEGVIDLRNNKINAQLLAASDGDFKFLTPTAEYIKTHPAPENTDTIPSEPMQIRCTEVWLSGFSGLYGVDQAKPQPGFDASYLQLSGVNVRLDNFYNEASTLRLPIRELTAKERCGLEITEGSGLVQLDSLGINLDNLKIKTPYSRIDLTANIPFTLMELKPDAPVDVSGDISVGIPDLLAFMPSLRDYTKYLPQKNPINLSILTSGTLTDIKIPKLDLAVPSVLSLRASGSARNPLDFKKLQAKVDIDGELTNPGIADKYIGDVGFKLPKLKVNGWAEVDRETYSTDLTALTSAGDLAARGRVNLNAESYDATVGVKNLNVAYFLPEPGIGLVTADLSARGNGFNPLKPRATTDIKLYVASIEYKGKYLHDIILDASLGNHDYDIYLSSENSDLDIELDLNGTLAEDDYSAHGQINCYHLDLQALGLDTAANRGSFYIDIDGSAQPNRWLYDVDLSIHNFEWEAGKDTISLPDEISARLLATTEEVELNLECAATELAFSSPEPLKRVVDQFSQAATIATGMIDKKEFIADSVQRALPRFDLNINSPGQGLISQFLGPSGISLDTISAHFQNDSIITGYADVLGLHREDLGVDTITLNLDQRGSLIDYRVHIGNKPGTLDEFAKVNLNGYIGDNRLSAYLTQENIKGETGYKLGFTAAMTDSLATIHFTPLKAMIGYHQWQLNSDNYVDINLKNFKIDADLEASSNESAILLETRAGADDLQELHVKLTNLHVQDFLQMSATAPPLTATVNTDIRARYDGEELVGMGRIGLSDLSYDRQKIDDMNLSVNASMDMEGNSDVEASLLIDNRKALTLATKLEKGEDGLKPDFVKLNLNEFPLSVANPFLGNDVAQVKGAVSGQMMVTGDISEPLINGSLECDSTSVYLPIMGSSLRFDDTPLTVTDNVIHLNKFDIWGANDNPLTIDGSVDARKFSDIQLDISANANNFQLLNNDRRAGSDLYGKLFLNLSASAKGALTHFSANANLNILGATDVYYTIPDANTAIQAEQNTDVVKFVNLNDTTTIDTQEQESVFMKLTASVGITPGAMATVNLSNNGTDKVQLSPSGTVNLYRNWMGDITLNGQLTLGNGFARYNIPVIGNKEFVFDPASYVLWNGPMMNPILNIKATDTMRVNVMQDNNSHLINFLVTAMISNNLNAPKVLFDLSTDDDITIENQLQGMTAEQRNSTAMNLLITGQYSVGGVSTSNGPFVGNVYNFLTQQLNSWAAKNIRGVDLSFGVDQYNKTDNGQTSTATSYSYQLSKSLFNNRFKISVGGNYSTGDSADDNLTQNLISDISFEYILKQTQSQTMLLKLFRHNGYESILEGEITEMGGGFVYKRKLGNFKSFFDTGRRRNTHRRSEQTDSIKEETPQER